MPKTQHAPRRKVRRTTRRRRPAMGKGRKRRTKQPGGFFPLLALIPAAVAAGKAAALSAVSGAVGYGIKKALDKAR